MATDPLAVYLNDHLAGSVAAVNMMEELAEHERGRPLEQKLLALRAEVEEEQQMLRELLARIDAGESRLKQAAAWITEKVGQGKLAIAARVHPALATLQGLESLALGLEGKHCLYRVLDDIAPKDPRLSEYRFAAFVARTVIQQSMIEHERMAAARAAFGASEATEARRT
jgi:cell division protein ZapA (FtsZ GTPase activity inhibitor)